MMKRMIPTGKKARNQEVQSTVATPDLAANSTANGFGAWPVRKIEEDTQVTASDTQLR